jgi:carboxymethylenebutenolidase
MTLTPIGEDPLVLISPHDGFMMTAHFSRAVGPRRGGVVVLQEIFGLTDHIRAMCDRFADAGYDALAPGLFERIDRTFHASHDTDGIAKGRAAVNASPWAQVHDDVQAAIDKLRADGGPVFVTGFCYGGAVAWLAAARCTGLSGASCFYGRLINELLDDAPKVPTILHYGAHDGAIPLTMVDDVRAHYPALACHVYEAGHGFCREGSSDFDAAARDLSMERTLSMFAELAR